MSHAPTVTLPLLSPSKQLFPPQMLLLCYRQASSTEKKLLGMLTPPREAEEDNGTPTLTKAGAGASAGSQQHLVDNPSNKRGKTNFASPPPPLLFSRSHSSIELLPLLFYPSHSNNGFGDGGRKRVVETALVASNATSTTTATAVSQQSRRQTRNSPRIAKVHRSLPILYFARVRLLNIISNGPDC